MKPRPDLLDENSPEGIEVFQLTTEPDTPGSHLYMEAQIFAPDSKRFVLHRSANAHNAGPMGEAASIYVAELGEPGQDALSDFRYLLSPRSTCVKESHIHPFLSPDGTMAFFNSDESGILQAYMIRGV